MLIKFFTYNPGHLVSDKEFERLKKAFAKEDMELVRKDDPRSPDIIMVKGFSHEWKDLWGYFKPIVYYSIGTEYKKGIDIREANRPIEDLYHMANAVVHISNHCAWEHEKVFGYRKGKVIIPACEANLPDKYPPDGKLKLATTCIPRPVKRNEELEKLCKERDIELITAYGNVSDFDYYHDCHGYIHVSRKEGMPNTVLEALSYGLPCIATNYGGAKEAIGEAGIIIQNDPEGVMWNPEEIEPVDSWLFNAAITEFIQNLDTLRMKTRGRILGSLNDKVMAQKFKEVFKKLL